MSEIHALNLRQQNLDGKLCIVQNSYITKKIHPGIHMDEFYSLVYSFFLSSKKGGN